MSGSSGSLSDFPVLLTAANLPAEMFDSDGSSPAQSGGGDVRFTTDEAGDNPIPADLRVFVTDPDPANGQANIAVRVPGLDQDADTLIYVWWNTSETRSQPAASDPLGRNAVYSALVDGGKGAVYAGGELVDRTGNGFDLTIQGSVPTVTGLNGPAWDFNTSDDMLNADAPVEAVPHTASALARRDDSAERAHIIQIEDTTDLNDSGQNNNIQFIDDSFVTAVGSDANGSAAEFNDNVVVGQFHYVTGIYDSLTSRTQIFDGSVVDTDTTDIGSQNTLLSLRLGHNTFGQTQDRPSTIEEVRIPALAVSDDWAITESNNLLDAANFASPGTPQDTADSETVSGAAAATIAAAVAHAAGGAAHGGEGAAATASVEMAGAGRLAVVGATSAAAAALRGQASAALEMRGSLVATTAEAAAAASGRIPHVGPAALTLAPAFGNGAGLAGIAGTLSGVIRALAAASAGSVDAELSPGPGRLIAAEPNERISVVGKSDRSLITQTQPRLRR